MYVYVCVDIYIYTHMYLLQLPLLQIISKIVKENVYFYSLLALKTLNKIHTLA
jgi:hypothetical protein